MYTVYKMYVCTVYYTHVHVLVHCTWAVFISSKVDQPKTKINGLPNYISFQCVYVFVSIMSKRMNECELVTA